MEELNDILEYSLNDNKIAEFFESATIRDAGLTAEFEALNRLLDSHEILTDWQANSSNESFEVSIKPMLSLLFAGTDIVVGDISNESAATVISRISKAVMDMVVRIFNAIIDAVANFDLVSTWLLRNIQLMERKRVTSRGKVPKEDYVTLPQNHRFLRFGRTFADQPYVLLRELKTLKTTLDIIGNDYTAGLERGAAAVRTRTNRKLGEDLKQGLLEAVEDVGLSRIAMRLGMSPISKERFGREGTKATSPLIGGKSIFYLDGDLSQRGLGGLRSHGLTFGDTYRNPFPVAAEREFVTLSVSDLSGMSDVLKDIVMSISKSSGGKTMTSMKNIRNSLKSYMQSCESATYMTEDDIKMVRSTVNAFTSWSKNVINPFYGNALQVVRVTLTYANKSTQTYH